MVAQELAGTGVASTLPKPTLPAHGARGPPSHHPSNPVPSRPDTGGNAGTGVPQLVAVGACLAVGGMNSPASPWESLSGRGRAKVPKSLGAGAVLSGTSDPGCL